MFNFQNFLEILKYEFHLFVSQFRVEGESDLVLKEVVGIRIVLDVESQPFVGRHHR